MERNGVVLLSLNHKLLPDPHEALLVNYSPSDVKGQQSKVPANPSHAVDEGNCLGLGSIGLIARVSGLSGVLAASSTVMLCRNKTERAQ